MSKYTEAVAESWNNRTRDVRNKFWLFPAITGHINQKIIGKNIPGVSSGFNNRLSVEGPFDRAISVGCGQAGKELSLLKSGTVRHFDLFELAPERMKSAEEAYKAAGFGDKATFNVRNAFEEEADGLYDLVYWNSSLHHMPSARQAIEWSRKALKPQGLFAMFEYVGPTRFQWTERNLRFMNDFLAAVPDRLFEVDGHPGAMRSRKIRRATIEQMLSVDPSEAADSSSIIPSLEIFFPEAKIEWLGGALYHFGLKPILPNIEDDPDGAHIMNSALLLDDALSELGENHFAYCFARRN
jgi:SAM-dependent methyltransferase